MSFCIKSSEVLICLVSESILTAYLLPSQCVDLSFVRNSFIFFGISTVGFRASSSGAVFGLSVQNICRFINFSKIS